MDGITAVAKPCEVESPHYGRLVCWVHPKCQKCGHRVADAKCVTTDDGRLMHDYCAVFPNEDRVDDSFLPDEVAPEDRQRLAKNCYLMEWTYWCKIPHKGSMDEADEIMWAAGMPRNLRKANMMKCNYQSADRQWWYILTEPCEDWVLLSEYRPRHVPAMKDAPKKKKRQMQRVA